MFRFPLFVVACLLVAGCSKAPSSKNEDNKSNTSGNETTTKPDTPAKGTPAGEAAADYLNKSYRGSEVEILSSKEHPVTTVKTVGTALEVEWRLKGNNERHHQILLIQADKVVSSMPYDPGKSLEANAAALVKQHEN